MSKQTVVVPSAGESVTEVSVANLIVSEGAVVKDGDGVIEIETDKASMEVPAPRAGQVHFVVRVGDTLRVGDALFELDDSVTESQTPVEEKPAPEKEQAPVQEEQKPTPEAPPEPKSEPKAPAGDNLQVSKQDFLDNLHVQKPTETPVKEPTKSVSQESERKPMSKLRKVIAKRLVAVKNETAMLTTFNEIDMSAVANLRAKEKEAFQKKHAAKLTYLPFFIKAAVSALQEFPEINAFIDGDDIVYNKDTHIGIAVSTDKGLVVPIMRQANHLSFIEMTQAITELAKKAQDRKLTVEDMSGGTFTITNGGVFGSMLSTPIINPPQSAILGMHNIVDRPWVVDGKIEIRPIMYVALSYDHRIVDGKEAVSFLVHMKKILEDPARFLLYG